MYTRMPKPDRELQARLDALAQAGTLIGNRGATSEDEGRAYGGRPRGASKKRTTNMARVRGSKAKFDSYYGYQGG